MKNLKIQFAVLLLSTLCLLNGAYGQITPGQDAYTNSADPTTNYGAAVTLGVVSSATSIQSTYIQFDLSSIPAGYTSANVAKATLKLYVNAVTTAGSFNVDYVNGTWTEKTIKASLAPALGGTIAASVPLTSSNVHDYVLIDVTSALGAWLNGTQTNDGIALVANSPLSATIDSKESTSQSHPAELDVVFNGAITGITTASGSGLTGGGTSGTLNLSLTTACAANHVLQYNGTSWICAAAGTGTVTSVASGTGLTGGPITGSGTLSINTGIVPLLASTNTFTGNQTVEGTLQVISAAVGGFGVEGFSNAQTGAGIGVFGSTAGPSGYGVEGVNAGNSEGAGVYGLGPYGVEGISNIAGVVGMLGTALSQTGASLNPHAGVWGDNAEAGYGVVGTVDDRTAGYFANNAPDTSPTLNLENKTAAANVGGSVFSANMPNLLTGDASAIFGDPGCGETSGNMALQLGQTGMSSCANYTMIGNTAGSTYINAVTGQNVHLRVNNSDALVASSTGVSIPGTLSVTGTKHFKIDHPLDPANKYLYHASIESSEVLNLYSGNVTLDDSGAAVVQLPDWFEAINKDFRYQLTPIGAPGQGILYIAEEVSGGHFKIAGGKAGGKVSWQVTGVRNDAWEKAYPMVVEADKGSDRGHYLTPELYGQPATARIGYETVPPENEQIVRHQRPSLHSGNASPARTITLPAPPTLVLPKVVPSRHAARVSHPAQASKPELNQK